MDLENRFIHKKLCQRHGSCESTEIVLVTDMKKGTSELLIEHTISERYPTKDLDKVNQLFDKLGKGGGRRLPQLKNL